VDLPYIRQNLHEKVRDIFEEGIITVVNVRDFSLIFDSYMQFEENKLANKMETTSHIHMDNLTHLDDFG
jgi:pre-mRNA-splicing factor SYF1